MLVSMNGKDEVVLPLIPADGPEGSYVVNSSGTMERTHIDDFDESDTECIREQVFPEEEIHSLLVRRSFHATPRVE